MAMISAIIPARNEEATLGLVLTDLCAALSRLNDYESEIIVVNDHSTDKTKNIAQSYGVTVISNMGKHGKGMTLRTGFGAAHGDILLMLDADYSHRSEDLPLFLNALKDNIGLVIGSRVVGGSEEYTHIRALGNIFLSTMVGLCTGRYLSDALNGYKLFRKEIFTDFQYTAKGFDIEIEIIANTLRHGYRITEVSSHERARAGGVAKSKVVKHGLQFLMRILWEGFKGVKPIETLKPARVIEKFGEQNINS
jgi:glycosyltransferase involved in cell wall biosynthesis